MKREEIIEDFNCALITLRSGGIIAYPTDTIWGIGCDASNDQAVEKLFEIKKRPSAKAMISLVDSIETLKSHLDYFPIEAEAILRKSETPLTVIFDSPKGISDKLKAEDGSAAFRIPQLEFVSQLCRLLGRPLVSTSANFSGTTSPKLFLEIDSHLLDSTDYVCQYGRGSSNIKPSKIIKITNSGELSVIRE